jgi:hypothetical protein
MAPVVGFAKRGTLVRSVSIRRRSVQIPTLALSATCLLEFSPLEIPNEPPQSGELVRDIRDEWRGNCIVHVRVRDEQSPTCECRAS